MPNQSLFARLGYILLGALLLHLLWATLSLVMQKALLPTPLGCVCPHAYGLARGYGRAPHG